MFVLYAASVVSLPALHCARDDGRQVLHILPVWQHSLAVHSCVEMLLAVRYVIDIGWTSA